MKNFILFCVKLLVILCTTEIYSSWFSGSKNSRSSQPSYKNSQNTMKNKNFGQRPKMNNMHANNANHNSKMFGNQGHGPTNNNKMNNMHASNANHNSKMFGSQGYGPTNNNRMMRNPPNAGGAKCNYSDLIAAAKGSQQLAHENASPELQSSYNGIMRCIQANKNYFEKLKVFFGLSAICQKTGNDENLARVFAPVCPITPQSGYNTQNGQGQYNQQQLYPPQQQQPNYNQPQRGQYAQRASIEEPYQDNNYQNNNSNGQMDYNQQNFSSTGPQGQVQYNRNPGYNGQQGYSPQPAGYNQMNNQTNSSWGY